MPAVIRALLLLVIAACAAKQTPQEPLANSGSTMQPVQQTTSTDRDGDGIADTTDACPDDPEDMDGFSDTDGCPDPDNDQDTILDAQDQCPFEPETFNGKNDEDGCPP